MSGEDARPISGALRAVSWIASVLMVLMIFAVINNAFSNKPNEFQRDIKARMKEMNESSKKDIRQTQIRQLDDQISRLDHEREAPDKAFQERLKTKQEIYKIDGE